jgi:hypothetical protein
VVPTPRSRPAMVPLPVEVTTTTTTSSSGVKRRSPGAVPEQQPASGGGMAVHVHSSTSSQQSSPPHPPHPPVDVTTTTTSATQQSFYRRQLPTAHCVAFSSAEGRRLFQEALGQGGLESYFPLSEQFKTQDDPAFCGLGALTMVLNALAIDPGRTWKGPWRWFDESMLECCEPLEVVRARGICISKLDCLARCNGATTQLKYGDSVSLAEFRADIVRLTSTEPPPDELMIVGYNRKVMGQTGTGHFSPVGGYHRGRDMALIMDVARFKCRSVGLRGWAGWAGWEEREELEEGWLVGWLAVFLILCIQPATHLTPTTHSHAHMPTHNHNTTPPHHRPAALGAGAAAVGGHADGGPGDGPLAWLPHRGERARLGVPPLHHRQEPLPRVRRPGALAPAGRAPPAPAHGGGRPPARERARRRGGPRAAPPRVFGVAPHVGGLHGHDLPLDALPQVHGAPPPLHRPRACVRACLPACLGLVVDRVDRVGRIGVVVLACDKSTYQSANLHQTPKTTQLLAAIEAHPIFAQMGSATGGQEAQLLERFRAGWEEHGLGCCERSRAVTERHVLTLVYLSVLEWVCLLQGWSISRLFPHAVYSPPLQVEVGQLKRKFAAMADEAPQQQQQHQQQQQREQQREQPEGSWSSSSSSSSSSLP